MKTKEEIKEFALSQIAPYYQNPEICGYDEVTKSCRYFTKDGKMCVAGKNMIDPKSAAGSINIILHYGTQEEVFKPEALGFLTNHEWAGLQIIHDEIAKEWGERRLIECIEDLNLFTFEELENYVVK